MIGATSDEGNNSTLRRKLFAGLNDDSDVDDSDTESVRAATSDDERRNVMTDDEKENDISNIIMPGSVMMTPTPGIRKEKSPNKSVSNPKLLKKIKIFSLHTC